jgi:hypothetical protein
MTIHVSAESTPGRPQPATTPATGGRSRNDYSNDNPEIKRETELTNLGDPKKIYVCLSGFRASAAVVASRGTKLLKVKRLLKSSQLVSLSKRVLSPAGVRTAAV